MRNPCSQNLGMSGEGRSVPCPGRGTTLKDAACGNRTDAPLPILVGERCQWRAPGGALAVVCPR